MLLPILLVLAASPPPDIAKPFWKHLPTDRQLATAYPTRTEIPDYFDLDLRCRVTDGFGHVRCVVIEESPTGYDVGAPVASLFTRFGQLDVRRMPGSGSGRIFVMHVRIRPK